MGQTRAIAGARVDACDAQGRCALAVAVQSCACRTVERLLAAGANVAVADAGGRTALHYAAQKGASHVPPIVAQGNHKQISPADRKLFRQRPCS